MIEAKVLRVVVSRNHQSPILPGPQTPIRAIPDQRTVPETGRAKKAKIKILQIAEGIEVNVDATLARHVQVDTRHLPHPSGTEALNGLGISPIWISLIRSGGIVREDLRRQAPAEYLRSITIGILMPE